MPPGVATFVAPIKLRHPDRVVALLADTPQAASHGSFSLGLGLGGAWGRGAGLRYGVAEDHRTAAATSTGAPVDRSNTGEVENLHDGYFTNCLPEVGPLPRPAGMLLPCTQR